MDNDKKTFPPRLGLWNNFYTKEPTRKMYHDPYTGKVAGDFINQESIITVEDWGCGFGGFKELIGAHQIYIGIDGSNSPFASKIVELETYTSNVDAIHMRHVLEHNPAWLTILQNALKSFNKRMVLTLFTPFQNNTTILSRYPNFNNTGVDMIDISFCRDDIISQFSNVKWSSSESIKTRTQYGIEHMFFLEKT